MRLLTQKARKKFHFRFCIFGCSIFKILLVHKKSDHGRPLSFQPIPACEGGVISPVPSDRRSVNHGKAASCSCLGRDDARVEEAGGLPSKTSILQERTKPIMNFFIQAQLLRQWKCTARHATGQLCCLYQQRPRSRSSFHHAKPAPYSAGSIMTGQSYDEGHEAAADFRQGNNLPDFSGDGLPFFKASA